MLSKVIRGQEAETLELDRYRFPTPDEIKSILEEKKLRRQREGILEEHREDPLKAATREADRMLLKAQEKIKDAELEAELIKKRKEEEIRRELEEEFKKKLEEEVKKVRGNYFTSLDELGKLKEALYKKSELQLLDLVFAVSRKVLESEIKSSPDIIMKMMEKGLKKLRGAGEYRIKINPADHGILSAREDDIKQMLEGGGDIQLIKDDTVEQGGCRIETDRGEVSSEPGKLLEIIMKELSENDGA